MAESDDTRLHRNGSTSALGKLDEKFEGFRIESVVKARFAERAAVAGKNPTEFLREVMQVIAFGPDEVKRMHAERIDLVVEMLAGKSNTYSPGPTE